MKKIAVFDWDGTIRKGFTINDWLYFLTTKETSEEKQNIYKNIKRYFDYYYSGIIDHDKLCNNVAQEYLYYLTNKSIRRIEKFAEIFFQIDKSFLYSFSTELLKLFKQKNYNIVIISGAPYEILKKYMRTFYIDDIYSLEIERTNDVFGNKIINNFGLSNEKKSIVEKLASQGEIEFAFGNSISDKPLLEIAKRSFLIESKYDISFNSKNIIKLHESNVLKTLKKII